MFLHIQMSNYVGIWRLASIKIAPSIVIAGNNIGFLCNSYIRILACYASDIVDSCPSAGLGASFNSGTK